MVNCVLYKSPHVNYSFFTHAFPPFSFGKGHVRKTCSILLFGLADHGMLRLRLLIFCDGLEDQAQTRATAFPCRYLFSDYTLFPTLVLLFIIPLCLSVRYSPLPLNQYLRT
jgi:hypothetical protein